MASSKLFSGELPELSIYIIQNLRNNFNTLYSLALVNRFWCRLAISLLWEDPFSTKCQENTSHFLDTYLLFLNDNDKIELKENLKFYKFVSSSQKPLFNYPSLIKTLNNSRVQVHVANWFNSSDKTTPTSSISLAQSSSNRKSYSLLLIPIFITLFKLFIENNASLNSLYISINDYASDQLYCGVYDVILNNPKFISEIKIFSFECSYYWSQQSQLNKSLQTFLSSLPSLLTSIKHIDILTINTNFEKTFSNMIQSQPQISSIKTSLLGILLLDSLKYISNTLTSINFSSCRFSNSERFDALSYLTQLESLQFKDCKELKSNVIQPLLNINTPLKIKSFVIVDNEIANKVSEKFIPIQLLIQKIGFYLENLVLNIYEDKLRNKLFDVVIDFCEKLKFLHLRHINFTNIPQLSKMFYKFDNNLKYLTLEYKLTHNIIDDNHEEVLKISSMILKELSKSLFPSLYYLDLNLIINPNDLQDFFENCKQVELKKLLIRNWNKINLDTTLKVIRDFVKEKNLEFLAYSIGNIKDEICYESLEKLVEEIHQSFVRMKNYDDLVVKVSDIDGHLIIS